MATDPDGEPDTDPGGAPLVAVSAMQPSEAAPKLVAVSAKPKVQLRPISEARPPAFSTRAGDLGYLAPPAARRVPPPTRRPIALIVFVVAAAILAIGLVASLR